MAKATTAKAAVEAEAVAVAVAVAIAAAAAAVVAIVAMASKWLATKNVVAERGSQHREGLAPRREGPIPWVVERYRRSQAEVNDCWRFLPGSILDASLALVETDP